MDGLQNVLNSGSISHFGCFVVGLCIADYEISQPILQSKSDSYDYLVSVLNSYSIDSLKLESDEISTITELIFKEITK